MQRQRDDFHLFSSQVMTSSKAVTLVEDPKLRRQKQVPRRLQLGDFEQHRFQSLEDYHCAQYVEAIDASMMALNERFDQEIYSVLMNIETVLINAVNSQKFEFNGTVKRLYKDDLDFLSAGGRVHASERNNLATTSRS